MKNQWGRSMYLRNGFKEKLSFGMYPTSVLHHNGLNGKISGNIGAVSEIRNSITILHGPRGCAYHYRHAIRRKHMPFFNIESTDLTEKEVIYGCEDKLKYTIDKVLEKYNPEIIFVLPTTCSDMINCDIKTVVEQYKENEKCRVIGIKSQVFSHIDKSQAKNNITQRVDAVIGNKTKKEYSHNGCGFNEVMCTIVNEVMKPQTIEDNLVNIESFGWGYGGDDCLQDIKEYLSLADIRINTLIPSASLKEIENAPKAKLNIVRRLRWAKQMQNKFGTDYIHFHSPTDTLGIKGIEKFYMLIAERLNKSEEMKKVLSKKHEEIEDELNEAKGILSQYKYALYSRSYNEVPYLIKYYNNEFGMKLSYVMVEMNEKVVKDKDISQETLEKMRNNLKIALEIAGCDAVIIDNKDSSEIRKVVEDVDFVINGKKLLSDIPEAKSLHSLHYNYVNSYLKFKELVVTMAKRVEAAKKGTRLIISRFDYDETYYPMLKDENIAASHKTWINLWTLRRK